MKAGLVAVVGRANAGKSTLINVLVGEKISIVSPKPQTTRDRIMGILTTDNYQIAFVDTPGIFQQAGALNQYMQRTARESVKDVDLILFLIDGHEGLADKDVKLLSTFSGGSVPLLAVLTKTDITPERTVIANLKTLADAGVDVVPVSARRGKNLSELIKTVLALLPDDDPLFSDDTVSDKSARFMVGEIMREKILLKYEKEIPHGVAVVVNEFCKRDGGNLYDVNLDIVCERPAHKAILIGKQGKAIKEAASFARQDMEKFLGAKVFLTTYVKVKEDWRASESLVRELGYDDRDSFL